MTRITLVLAVLCLSIIGFAKKGSCAPVDTKTENSKDKDSIDPTADVSNEVNVLLDDDSGKKKDNEIAQTPESSEINTDGEDVNSNVDSNNLQQTDVEDDNEEVAVKPSAGANVTNEDSHTKKTEDESDDASESKEKNSNKSEVTSKSNEKSSKDNLKNESDSYVEPSEDALDGLDDPDSTENTPVDKVQVRINTNVSEENDSDSKKEGETDKDTIQSEPIKGSEDLDSTSKTKLSDESEDGISNEKLNGSVSPPDSAGKSKGNSNQESHQIDASVNNAGGDDTSNNTETPQLNKSEAFSSLPTTITSNLVSLFTDSGGNDGNVSKGVEAAISESTEKIEKVSTQKDEDSKITTRSPTKEIPAEHTVSFVSEETSESTEFHKISSSPVTESTELSENNPEITTEVSHVVTSESSNVVSNTTANEPTLAIVEIKSTEAVASEVEEELGTTSMVTSTESVPSIPPTKSTTTYAAPTKKAWKKTKRPTKPSVEVSSTPYPDDNVTHKRKRPPVVPGRETGVEKGNKASVTSLTSTVSPSSNIESEKENTTSNVENNEELNSTDILTEVKNTVRKIMNEYGETNVTIVVIIALIILILLLCCCMRVCRGKRSKIRQRRLRVLVNDNLVQKEIGQEKEFLLRNRDKGRSQYSDGVTLLEGSSEDEF